jgi:hypothetical protein
MSAPIRGQRRPGVPSLVLPGDPDGCGWIAIGGGEYVPFPSPPTGHPARDSKPVAVRYVGRPTRWGNPYRVVKGRSGLLGVITPDERVVTLRTDCTGSEAARVAVRGFQHHLDHLDRSKPRAVLARHLAPLVTADVLSCWCPLDAPCHADTLCDLVGRLRSGVLVPGLVATPGVCGGALRIDGTRLSRIASNVRSLDAGSGVINDMGSRRLPKTAIDPDLVRLAAQVGGAL